MAAGRLYRGLEKEEVGVNLLPLLLKQIRNSVLQKIKSSDLHLLVEAAGVEPIDIYLMHINL